MEKRLSRLEQRALKAYPISTSYLSESNGDGDRNYPRRLAYIEGYEQAEKDLALTWGDVQLLDTFILELSREEKDGADWGDSEKFYTEVLRRFHEFNDKKIPEIVAEWEAKHLK